MSNKTATYLEGKQETTRLRRPELPATAPKQLLTRRKLPISVQFRLVPSETKKKREVHPIQTSIAKSLGRSVGEPIHLQVRILVNGERHPGFDIKMTAPLKDPKTGETYFIASQHNNFGSYLTIDPKLWDVKSQSIAGRTNEVIQFNEELARIKDRIKSIFYIQVDRFSRNYGPAPTAESVKDEYITGRIRLTRHGKSVLESNSILSAFKAYCDHCDSLIGTDMALSPETLYRRKRTLDLLSKFLTYENTPDLEAKQITQAWAKRFYTWLMQQGRMKPASVRTIIGVIRLALAHLIEQEQLEMNPLIGLKLPKGKPKEVVWLSPEQVEKLWQLKGEDAFGATLFWFKVIVLTGMDYPDAVRYVKNRDAYECVGIGGKKIVIGRGKNESECHIPYAKELDTLLAEPIPFTYSLGSINTHLKMIAILIDFPHALTTKVGRKTAGAQWLLEGYDIHAISRFLGHSRISTTEAHYIKTSGTTADRAMQQMRVKRQGNQSLTLHTASFTFD